MADEQTWTMEAWDLAGIPTKAPDVLFTMGADNRSFSAEPPLGRIEITAASQDGRTARIVVTCTVFNEVFADIVSTQVDAPSVGEDWKDPCLYASEIGCALYWSMWRRQQLRVLSAREALLRGVEAHKAKREESEPSDG